MASSKIHTAHRQSSATLLAGESSAQFAAVALLSDYLLMRSKERASNFLKHKSKVWPLYSHTGLNQEMENEVIRFLCSFSKPWLSDCPITLALCWKLFSAPLSRVKMPMVSQTATLILSTHQRLTTIPISCERKSGWPSISQPGQISNQPRPSHVTNSLLSRGGTRKGCWIQLVNWLNIHISHHLKPIFMNLRGQHLLIQSIN